MIKKIIYGCESRGDGNTPYLTRYTIIDRKNWQMCLHVFHRSDANEHHDHPWNFLSIIIWRGYIEETIQVCPQCGWDGCSQSITLKQRKYPLTFLYRRANHRHRVELINNKKAISLVFMGKRKREWGFFTSKGWQLWTRYFIERGC